MLKPSLVIKCVSGFLAGVLFVTNSAFLHAAETNFWADRSNQIENQRSSLTKKASSVGKSNDPSLLLASLPSAQPGLSMPFSPQALSKMGIAQGLELSKKAALAHSIVPDWIQKAVAPYATIQEIHQSQTPVRLSLTVPSDSRGTNSKTVFLIQDAHLHYEAQTNIAHVITNLSQTLKNRNSSLLVGLEGADVQEADLSGYNEVPHRTVLREVAQHFLKENVLTGAEFAAIGYLGDGKEGPVQLPMILTGVEDFEQYKALDE